MDLYSFDKKMREKLDMPEEKTKRKVIQITTGKDHTYVLCNDGTVWSRCFGEWVRIEDIPQD